MTAEVRLLLDRPVPAVPGHFQLFVFVDYGEVDFMENPWFPGSNHARRSAYDGGASWAAPGGIFIKATYGRKLGD